MPDASPMNTTLLFTLLNEEEYRTDGANARSTIINVPGLARLGPWIKSMRVHWEGEDFTQYFQAKVQLQWSVSGKTWSSGVDILPNQQAAGQVIGNGYSTVDNFGLNQRLSIVASNQQGTNVEAGRITAVLEVTLKT